MNKVAISITDAEKTFIDGRSDQLGCSVNEYMTRLIALGETVSSMQRPLEIPHDSTASSDQTQTDPVADISLVATTESGCVASRFIVSDLLY